MYYIYKYSSCDYPVNDACCPQLSHCHITFSQLQSGNLTPGPECSQDKDTCTAHLNSIDTSEACGSDALPGFLLKAVTEHICSPLSFLFTTSMRTAILPKDWVTANVVPVFKRGDRLYVKNYHQLLWLSR